MTSAARLRSPLLVRSSSGVVHAEDTWWSRGLERMETCCGRRLYDQGSRTARPPVTCAQCRRVVVRRVELLSRLLELP